MLNKNTLLYLLSNSFTVFCSNMIQFLLAVYVLKETKSATLYSIMLSIIVVPRLFVSPLAGVISDKINKLFLMRICLLLYFFSYSLFSVIEIFQDSIYIILTIVLLLEIIEIFYTSANTSMIPILSSEDSIAKITSISVTMESISNILAPVVGAICLSLIGFHYSLFFTSIISGICLIFFLFIRENNYLSHQIRESTIQMLIEAITIIKNDHFIFSVILIAPIINFFLATLLTITYVYYLNTIMGVSPLLYGIFEGGCGVSAIVGGIVATIVIDNRNHLKTLYDSLKIIALIIFLQIFIITITIPQNLAFTLFFISAILVNISLMVMNTATSVTIKRIINVDYMGRITMIINLLATIALPIGQLLYGKLADKYPSSIAFLLTDAGLIFAIFLLKRRIIHE